MCPGGGDWLSRPFANDPYMEEAPGWLRVQISRRRQPGEGNVHRFRFLAATDVHRHTNFPKCVAFVFQAQRSTHFPEGVDGKNRGKTGAKNACIRASSPALKAKRNDGWGNSRSVNSDGGIQASGRKPSAIYRMELYRQFAERQQAQRSRTQTASDSPMSTWPLRPQST